MKYRLKMQEVEAVQHQSPSSINVVGRKGQQTARPGDYILIYGDRPEDREVLTAKDFGEKYEPIDDDGNVIEPKKAQPGEAYGVPHFDTIELAQTAAQAHYIPVDQSDPAAKPNFEPFKCTIGNTDHLYEIQPSGIVNQIPVQMPDASTDPGFGLESGAVEQNFPNTLANQGGAVRDDTGPKSSFQQGTAASETPAQTFGNGYVQPDNGADEVQEENKAVNTEHQGDGFEDQR